MASFKVKRKIVFTIISFITIVCFQGLRWRTGSDWQAYLDCFEASKEYKVGYVEFGYYWYNKFIRLFTDSYTVFLLVQSTTIYGCIWKFANDFEAKNISVIMGVFLATNIFPVRFALACAIYLLGYRYIRDRNFFKFLIIYLLAVSIHQIIALTLPLYFIADKDYKSKTLWAVYGSCCFIGLLSEMVFGNLLQAFNLVFAYLPQFSQDKAEFYLNQENEARSIIMNLVSFINGGIFIFLFLKIREKNKSLSGFNVLLNMYVFGLSLSRIFLNTIPYLSRINLCCTGGFPILLLIGIYKFKRLRPVLVLIFAIYEYFSFMGQIEHYPELFLPYYSIFSESQRSIVF